MNRTMVYPKYRNVNNAGLIENEPSRAACKEILARVRSSYTASGWSRYPEAAQARESGLSLRQIAAKTRL